MALVVPTNVWPCAGSLRPTPPHIVVAVLSELASSGEIPPEIVAKAITEYGIDTEADAPWTR